MTLTYILNQKLNHCQHGQHNNKPQILIRNTLTVFNIYYQFSRPVTSHGTPAQFSGTYTPVL